MILAGELRLVLIRERGTREDSHASPVCAGLTQSSVIKDGVTDS